MGAQTFTFTKNHTGFSMHTAIQGILQSVLQWHITSSGTFIEMMGIVV